MTAEAGPATIVDPPLLALVVDTPLVNDICPAYALAGVLGDGLVAGGLLVSDLISIYSVLARRWASSELVDRFGAACDRGNRDLCPADRDAGPIAQLATSVPQATSIAIAAHTLHLLPAAGTVDRGTLVEDLIETIDVSSSGALRRCQLALEHRGGITSEQVLDSLAVAYVLAGELLQRTRVDVAACSIPTHAQEAVRWIAVAIDADDRDDPAAFTEAISDCLGRLLVVSIFADAAQDRLPVSTTG